MSQQAKRQYSVHRKTQLVEGVQVCTSTCLTPKLTACGLMTCFFFFSYLRPTLWIISLVTHIWMKANLPLYLSFIRTIRMLNKTQQQTNPNTRIEGSGTHEKEPQMGTGELKLTGRVQEAQNSMSSPDSGCSHWLWQEMWGHLFVCLLVPWNNQHKLGVTVLISGK